MSYLSRHRPICAVLQEISELAQARDDVETIVLCNEAVDYAQRMSKRLQELKSMSAKIKQFGIMRKRDGAILSTHFLFVKLFNNLPASSIRLHANRAQAEREIYSMNSKGWEDDILIPVEVTCEIEDLT